MDIALIPWLRRRLREPLPGLEAQLALSSHGPNRKVQARPDHRKSGVLALLYPDAKVMKLVFMQRTDDGKVHGGQVSFPGGSMEREDLHLTATALRETEEELGVPRQAVEVLGQLSPLYIPPSNFWVLPTVGFVGERPHFRPDPTEVAAVLEVGVEELLADHQPSLQVVRVRGNVRYRVPAFRVRDQIIWGATAMMLNELLVILKEWHQGIRG